MDDPWVYTSIETQSRAKEFRDKGHGSTIGGLIVEEEELYNPSHYLSQTRMSFSRSTSYPTRYIPQKYADKSKKYPNDPREAWHTEAEDSYPGSRRESLVKMAAERRAREEEALEARERALRSAQGKYASSHRMRSETEPPVGDYANGPIALWHQPNGETAPLSEYDERFRSGIAPGRPSDTPKDVGETEQLEGEQSDEIPAQDGTDGMAAAPAARRPASGSGRREVRASRGTRGASRPGTASSRRSEVSGAPGSAAARARRSIATAKAEAAARRQASTARNGRKGRIGPKKASAGKGRPAIGAGASRPGRVRPMMTPTQRANLRRAHAVAARAAREAGEAPPAFENRSAAPAEVFQPRARERRGRQQEAADEVAVRAWGADRVTSAASGAPGGEVEYEMDAEEMPDLFPERGALPGDDEDSDISRTPEMKEGSDGGAAAEGGEDEQEGPEEPSSAGAEASAAERRFAAWQAKLEARRAEEAQEREERAAALEARATALRARYFGTAEAGAREQSSEYREQQGGDEGASRSLAPPPFAVGPPPLPHAPQPPAGGEAGSRTWRRTATSYLMMGENPPAELDPPPHDRRPLEELALGGGYQAAVAPFDVDGARGKGAGRAQPSPGRTRGTGGRSRLHAPTRRSRSPVQANRRFPPRAKRAPLSEYDARFASPSALSSRNPYLPRR